MYVCVIDFSTFQKMENEVKAVSYKMITNNMDTNDPLRNVNGHWIAF